MSGIIFYKTERLKETVDFYTRQVNAKIWLDQGKCIILQHGNMLFGFCEGKKADIDGIITFFYPSAAEVNQSYQKLSNVADSKPRINSQYRIYHFFAFDPEGRKMEFQTFLHYLDEYWSGSELLCRRRSVRQFSHEEVSDELFNKVMEACRYSPTSRNSQSYYYVVTRDREIKSSLARMRDNSSKPLASAPMIVACCAESHKTKRPQQDACIAAYHLLLAAAQFGLGTCWITDMDRPEVKEMLDIPQDDYIACLTPFGYPLARHSEESEIDLQVNDEIVELPDRREARQLFRFI